MSIDADDVFERIENRYSDFGDPEGDGMFENVTTDEENDLSKRLTEVFHSWVIEHGLTLHYSSFQRIRNAEHVELPHPHNGDL